MRASRSLALLLNFLFLCAAASAQNYHPLKKVPLGGSGFWDYLTVEPAKHRLFISHGTHVEVVNTESYSRIADMPDTPGVHGIALASALGKGYISNGRENTVSVIDLSSLKLIRKIPAGQNPDAILFDPASRHVFAFNGRSHDITVIDTSSDKVLTTIPLNGKPEFAVADDEGQVFVNIEDKSAIALLDSRQPKVKSQWSLAPCEEPTGLAMDREHHLLFAGCSNKLMAVMDSGTGKVVTTLPIGDGVDGTAFDPATSLAFSSNGEGTLTLVHEDSPKKFRVVQTVQTERGARTLALDETTHHIYTVTARFAPSGEQSRRPAIVPESFVLLVYGR